MSGQTADMMRRSMKDMLVDQKPDLVVWQTGTVDAIRRIEPDEFRIALQKGVDTLLSAGTDVVLMNMQYSPRTESMIAVGPYADGMHAVAQQREVPLFDRFSIMRYWADEGTFDFNAAGRDPRLAQRVHDCLGRAIGTLVIAAGRLQAFDNKTGKYRRYGNAAGGREHDHEQPFFPSLRPAACGGDGNRACLDAGSGASADRAGEP